MRATCIDPTLLYNGPGCVSYDFFLDWDPDFVQSINRQFSMVCDLICMCIIMPYS